MMSLLRPLRRGLVVAVVAALPLHAQEPSNLVSQIDDILTRAYPADAPGAAVLVVHRGQVLLRKGYGGANLELGVPMKPEHIFRIGSITKQFTAVAILQLAEAGKLSLDDEITLMKMQTPPGQEAPPDSALRAAALERLIEDQLVLAKADLAGVTVTEEEIDEALANTLANMPL